MLSNREGKGEEGQEEKQPMKWKVPQSGNQGTSPHFAIAWLGSLRKMQEILVGKG